MAAITKVGSATFGITCTTHVPLQKQRSTRGKLPLRRPEQQGLDSQSLVKI